MNRIGGLVAAIAIGCATSSANALPYRLDYTVTNVGPDFQYNFTLVLDNNDNSWAPGQEFDWLVVGDAQAVPSPFTEGSSFFTSVPAGWAANSTGGFHNGPTLCFGAATCSLPGYVPAAVGDTILFTGLSSTFLGSGDLLWAMLENPTGFVHFEVANFLGFEGQSTPLPAALPLFAGGLGVMAFLARRRKQKALAAA